jgi:hypothetical protein
MSHTKDKPNNTALNKDLAPTSIVQDRPRAVVVDDKERAIVEKIEQDKSIQKSAFQSRGCHRRWRDRQSSLRTCQVFCRANHRKWHHHRARNA